MSIRIPLSAVSIFLTIVVILVFCVWLSGSNSTLSGNGRLIVASTSKKISPSPPSSFASDSFPPPEENHRQTITPEKNDVILQLPLAERLSFQQALQLAEYGVHPLSDNERQINPEWEKITHQASHREERLMLGFEESGLTRIVPGNAGWKASLSLSGPEAKKNGEWSHSGTRAEYRHSGGIIEWYANQPEGLEHGFTIEKRPASFGRRGFELLMDLKGLRAEEDESQTGDLVFHDEESGQPALGYRSLKVWDSTGRSLPSTMFPVGGGFRIAVNDTEAIYPVTIDPLLVNLTNTFQAPLQSSSTYVKSSNTGGSDYFGSALAIDGNTIVVGASGEASSATGVGGNQADDGSPGSGAVYVFVRSDHGIWSQQAYLKASNSEAGDGFGHSVAIFGDTIIVGAPTEDSAATGVNGSQVDNSKSVAGAAYVFTRSGNDWNQSAYLKASNTDGSDYFGFSTAISGDTIVVGAIGESSSAKAVNGNQADNTATGTGAAYVFVRATNGSWSQQAYLKGSNTSTFCGFGYSVAISGNTIVTGATSDGSSGSAYVFVRNGTNWSQQARLRASTIDSFHRFGESVSISQDTIVVGVPWESRNITGVNGTPSGTQAINSGAAYVYVRNGVTWSEQAFLKASNTGAYDAFGSSVAIMNDIIVVGAPYEDSSSSGINGIQSNDSLLNAGAAYVFVRIGSTWSQRSYLKASSPEADDLFGKVAISGANVVVGSPSEKSSAVGINGIPNSGTIENSGAAHIFHTGGAARDDHFGRAVALDGDIAAVGAFDHDHIGIPNTGKVWIFRRDAGVWNLEAGIIDDAPRTNDRFGIAVAVSGTRVAVGADRDDWGPIIDCGSVQVFFRNDNGSWSRRGGKLSPAGTGACLGKSVDLDGPTLIAGAPLSNGSGRVWTWYDTLDGGGNQFWEPTGILSANIPQAGAEFGYSVAVSGSNLLVGEPGRDGTVFSTTYPNAGSVTFFRKRFTVDTGPIGTWENSAINTFTYLVSNQGTGFSVAVDGNTAVVGACSPPGRFVDAMAGTNGTARIYTFDGSIWSQGPNLDTSGFSPNSYFGSAVAIQNGVVAVGAFGNGVLTGQVRIFSQENSAWVTQSTIFHASGESNNYYGLDSLALNNGNLLVGAQGADAVALIDAGQAYFYSIADPDAELPKLTITRSGDNVVLTWNHVEGWSLYQSGSLSSNSWTPVTVTTYGSHSYPISSTPKMFFRLQHN